MSVKNRVNKHFLSVLQNLTKSQLMSVKNRVNKHLDGHCRLYNNNGKDKVNIVTFIYNEASCFGKRKVLCSSGRVRCLLLCVWVLCVV